MSDFRSSVEGGRILPGGLELHSLPKRVGGAALVTVAGIGWLSLLTWSISDPSFNRAADGTPRNLLGTVGASIADVLLQLLGLGSITLFLPLAVWGLVIASGESVSAMRRRIAMWTGAMLLIASALSILPRPSGWVLSPGLGGVVGDFCQNLFLMIGDIVSPSYGGIVGAVIASYAGLWALLQACGIGLSDLRLLWHLPAHGQPSPAVVAPVVISLWERGKVLRQRLAKRVERETIDTLDYAKDDWRPDPVPLRRRARPAEMAPNPASSGAEQAATPAPAPEPPTTASTPRQPPRHGPVRAAATGETAPDDARVEPFFDAPPSFPAPEPPHRLVRILPMHAQYRQPPAQPSPSRSARAQAPTYTIDPRRHAEHAAYGMLQPMAYQQPHAASAGYPAGPPPYTPPPAPRTAAPPYAPEPYPSDDEFDEDLAAPPPRDASAERGRDRRPQPAPQPARRNAPSRSGPSARTLIAPPAEDIQQRFTDFQLPSLRLLNPAPERRGNPELSDVALGRKAEMLHGVLEDFGIKGTITGVHPGPVITLFELEPARGTKSSRVIGLADDIARSMSAVSARVAVIPGRDAIGIELPNVNRETVYLRELLESHEFAKGKAALPLALGKTIAGAPVTVDLARMPHLLVAGTTGSGKSVAINAMILSLLYRLTPEQCRFILIDPKMLELSVYDDIPHLLTPVVTDPRKAISALKWTVGEMNIRYERMCKLGVRNITGFNQKVSRAKLQGRPLSRTVQTGFDDDTGEAIYEREDIDDSPMPYIVVVIDETADLMMVAGKDIEFCVQRLSQMARAAGIHLIMATQRPSVDVITGPIKANFPSRIAFQVTSKIDSRTILGEQGADQLLGAGDMLSMAAGGRIMRAHGPFVSDEEVERVVDYLKEQAEPDYLDSVLEDTEPEPAGKRGGKGAVDGAGELSGEALYDQAVDIVIKERRATTSYLQRRLGIGYNRAASLIERMEQEGLISPPNRTGKREIRGPEGD